jgi:hypothetical protein
MELKGFDGLLVCSRPELLQRSLLHHQTRADFTVIRQKVEPMMAVICGGQANVTVGKDHKGHEEKGARSQNPGARRSGVDQAQVPRKSNQ